MNPRKIKDTKFNRFVARNSREIGKILKLFLILFIINFFLFAIDIYSDSTNFFFHWPLAISGVIFIVYAVRLSLWKHRHSPLREKKSDKKKGNERGKEEDSIR